jgi:hypothetical protein
MNTVVNLLGYKSESFSSIESLQSSSPGIFAAGGVGLLIFFAFGILYCYGAAKLSYSYNMSIGNGGSAFFWAVLCYFFAAIYYPYYAIMLNPVGSVMSGGRRR